MKTTLCKQCGFEKDATVSSCPNCPGPNLHMVTGSADPMPLDPAARRYPTVELGANKITEHTTVDLLCVSISSKLIKPAKDLNASQAELLTAMLKTSAMYAKHVKRPQLAAMLDQIVAEYEGAIKAGKSGALSAPATEITKGDGG